MKSDNYTPDKPTQFFCWKYFSGGGGGGGGGQGHSRSQMSLIMEPVNFGISGLILFQIKDTAIGKNVELNTSVKVSSKFHHNREIFLMNLLSVFPIYTLKIANNTFSRIILLLGRDNYCPEGLRLIPLWTFYRIK